MAKETKIKTADVYRHLIKLVGWVGTDYPPGSARATPEATARAAQLAQWIRDGTLELRLYDAPGMSAQACVQAGDVDPGKVIITLMCDLDVEGAVSQFDRIITLNNREAKRVGVAAVGNDE